MFKRKKKVNDVIEQLEAQNALLRDNYTQLQTVYKNVMATVDTAYTWNNIKYYDKALALSHSLYNYGEDFGCGYYRKCITYRAKATRSSGIEVNTNTGKQRELAFAKEFIKINGLNAQQLNRITIGAELEGKVLILLKPNTQPWTWNGNKEIGMVETLYIPYAEKHYNLICDNNGAIVSVDLGGGTVIPAERFVYYRVDQPCNDPNKTNIPCQAVFSECRGMEESCHNNRKQNNIFSDPLYVALCQDINAAEVTSKSLSSIAPKGKLDLNEVRLMSIAGSDVKAIVPPDRADIGEEQERLLRGISIKTGIPLPVLNAADVNNKNISEFMSETEGKEFEDERNLLGSAMTDIVSKAMALLNGSYTPYDTKEITCTIGKIGNDDWNRAANFWLPACVEGKISTTTLHENIPGIDPELEAKRLEKETKKAKEVMTESQKNLLNTLNVEDNHEHE